MYIDSASPSEQVECVTSLVEKIEKVRSHFGYSDKDARSVALNNIRAIARATSMTLSLLDTWSRNEEPERTEISQLLGLTDINNHSIHSAGRALHKTSKLSLALLGQFQIENCLANLARELSEGQETRSGFYDRADALIATLSLPGNFVDYLNVAALIRNSLHRNGIHYGHKESDTVTTLGGVAYQFHHQQKVSCARVEHISHALGLSIDVLATIFDSPEVGDLGDPVMDQYVWEIETAPSGIADS